MQNKMIWKRKTCKIRWFERIKYSKNLLQMWFMVKIQSESWKCPVGKILFSNWKIFISQLRNYFFPVGLFLSLFLDVFLFFFGLYLFIYTQYENLGTGKNIWQTTLGELPDAARNVPTFSKTHRLVSPLIPLPIPVFADGRCVYTSLSHGFENPRLFIFPSSRRFSITFTAHRYII